MSDTKGKPEEKGQPGEQLLPGGADPAAKQEGQGEAVAQPARSSRRSSLDPVLRSALLGDDVLASLTRVDSFLQGQLEVMRMAEANLQPILAMTRNIAGVAAWTSVVESHARFFALTGAPGVVSVMTDVNRSLERLLVPLQSEALRSMVTTLAGLSLDAPVYGIAAVQFRGLLAGPIYEGLSALRGVDLDVPEVAPATFSTFTASAVIGLAAPDQEASSELRDAETETRAAGIELIRRHRPDFAAKLEGALYVSERQSPDWMSQAANSLQELTDHVLREVAGQAEVLDWCRENFPKGVYDRQGAQATTRAGKVRYLAARAGISMNVAEAIVKILNASTDILQQAKHDQGSAPVLRNFPFIVEGFAGAIIAMAEETQPD